MCKKVFHLTLFNKACVLTLLVCFCFIVTSCQPTPEQETIISRTNASASYMMTDRFEPIEIPDKIYKADRTLGKATVSINADVLPLKATGYPIVQVKQDTFSDERISNILSTLISGNSTLYRAWERTVDDYIYLLTLSKQLDTEHEEVAGYIEWLTQSINNAPRSVDKEAFFISEALPKETYHVYAEKEGSVSSAMFKIDGDYFSYFRDINYNATPLSWLNSNTVYEKIAPALSEEDASDIAVNTMQSIGEDSSFVVLSCEPVIIHRVPKSEWGGWQIVLGRSYAGICTAYTPKVGMDAVSPPSTGAPWPKETLTIVVDEQGVFSLNWSNPIYSHDVITENAKLLPLEEITSRAQQQLLYLYSGTSELYPEIEHMQIDIDKVGLNMGVLSAKNNSNIGICIPIWQFFYTIDNGLSGADDTFWSMFISGIDGSYVEPNVTTQQIEDMAQRRK